MKYKHTQRIKSANIDNKKLATEIGDLYYDSLSEFLVYLSKKLEQDYIADRKRGREELANCLLEASNSINEASKHIDKAWGICKPYVDRWLIDHGSNRK